MTTIRSRHKLVKKTKDFQCWTDKTFQRLHCPKCKQTGHSKIFKSTENLARHLYQTHSAERHDYPSISQIMEVLEIISIAHGNNFSLDKLAEDHFLGIVAK